MFLKQTDYFETISVKIVLSLTEVHFVMSGKNRYDIVFYSV